MLAVWQAADEIELFESAWTFDHFYPIFSDPTGPVPRGVDRHHGAGPGHAAASGSACSSPATRTATRRCWPTWPPRSTSSPAGASSSGSAPAGTRRRATPTASTCRRSRSGSTASTRPLEVIDEPAHQRPSRPSTGTHYQLPRRPLRAQARAAAAPADLHRRHRPEPHAARRRPLGRSTGTTPAASPERARRRRSRCSTSAAPRSAAIPSEILISTHLRVDADDPAAHRGAGRGVRPRPASSSASSTSRRRTRPSVLEPLAVGARAARRLRWPSSGSPTSTTPAWPTTATSGSRRAGWRVERERGIFTLEGALSVEALLASAVRGPVGARRRGARRQDGGAPRCRRRRSSPCRRAAMTELTGVHFHRGVLAVAERPARRARWPTWCRAPARSSCSRGSTTTRTSAPSSATRPPSASTPSSSTRRPPTRSTGARPGCRSGHVLRVPFARADRWPDELDELRRRGLHDAWPSRPTPRRRAARARSWPTPPARLALVRRRRGSGAHRPRAGVGRPPGADPHGRRGRLGERGDGGRRSRCRRCTAGRRRRVSGSAGPGSSGCGVHSLTRSS